MALHDDLLAQAGQLASRERTRPKQASLRRAVSAAYYALFHLLTWEATGLIAKDDRLRQLLVRTYGHAEMLKVSKKFADGTWPAAFDPVKPAIRLPQALQDVAAAFVVLQQARHEADYDLAKTYTRSETRELVALARQAFQAWKRMRKDDAARVYLSCFLLWEAWSKKR